MGIPRSISAAGAVDLSNTCFLILRWGRCPRLFRREPCSPGNAHPSTHLPFSQRLPRIDGPEQPPALSYRVLAGALVLPAFCTAGDFMWRRAESCVGVYRLVRFTSVARALKMAGPVKFGLGWRAHAKSYRRRSDN